MITEHTELKAEDLAQMKPGEVWEYSQQHREITHHDLQRYYLSVERVVGGWIYWREILADANGVAVAGIFVPEHQ